MGGAGRELSPNKSYSRGMGSAQLTSIGRPWQERPVAPGAFNNLRAPQALHPSGKLRLLFLGAGRCSGS